MKNISMLFLLIGFFNAKTKAQSNNIQKQPSRAGDKTVIDSNAFGGWPKLVCEVSGDAKYVFSYTLSENAVGSTKMATLTINKIGSNAKTIYTNVNLGQQRPKFTSNSHQILFFKGKDSLCIFNLNNGQKQWLPQVSSFSLSGNISQEWLTYLVTSPERELHIRDQLSGKETIVPDVGSYEVNKIGGYNWISYQSASAKGKLTLLNPETGKRHEFEVVKGHFFSPDKSIALIKQIDGKLLWINLITGIRETVSEKLDGSSYTFDQLDHQMAFTVKKNGVFSVWYFKEGKGLAEQIVNPNQLPAGPPMSIGLKFNKSGTQLLLTYFTRYNVRNSALGAPINVWNYKDSDMPSPRLYTKEHSFGLNISNKQMIPLASSDLDYYDGNDANNFLVLMNQKKLDNYYNPASVAKAYLEDIATGSRITLFANSNFDQRPVASPHEKYFIWYDVDSVAWLGYETATGVKRNISKRVPYPMHDEYLQDIGRTQFYAYDIAGWSPDDSRVYLYDRYDIWEIDLQGVVAPICITKGLGRRSRITLGLMDPEKKDGYNNPNRVIHNGDKLVFSAYQPESKATGFWTLTAGSGKSPEQGALQPYGFAVGRYDRLEHVHADKPHGTITKIGNTNKYLVTRQSAEEFPNYFLTGDFKHYQQLTDFQPQKKYNWLSAELVNWTLPDGGTAQGVLYKPENFDPSKKYPLIFDYYQGRSMEFHFFRETNYTNGRINIPYYVSNGYLVFVPDVFLKKGNNSQAVVNAVSSAAHYLSKRSYVDSTKLGIQGHSLGGWETNVLVTHTQNLFAAACAADGPSDIISAYEQGTLNQGDNQRYYEFDGQLSPYGVGVTPWTNLEVYAKDSPVLFAGKATTPLLIVHGCKDEAVPFSQGMEMYSALRRSGKKVWLLEYVNAGHGPQGVDGEAKDLTLRMRQFFDYYLKGLAAPKWMTEDIATRVKDPNDLELDQTGAKP